MDAATGQILEECIARYGENKAHIKPFEDEIKKDNAKIKELMNKEKINEFHGGKYTATIRVDETKDIDKDKLIAIIQKDWADKGKGHLYCPYIITKYDVDMEALENAIYNGDFDATKLAECKIVKKTPKLIIKEDK